MNSTPAPAHIIRSAYNDLDMVGFVDGDFFRCGSCSGPLAPSFEDRGAVAPGAILRLAYNYATGEYVSRTGGWAVEVVRVNRKSITVRECDKGAKTYRVEL